MSQYQLLLSQKVTSLCPIIHLVLTQITTSPVPKKYIIMSHNSSWRDPKLSSPVPKITLFSHKNLSCHDHKSTSPVPKKWPCSVSYFILLWCNFVFSFPKSDMVLSYNLSHYDSTSTSFVPKSHLVCAIICHVLTQYQLLMSQKVTFLCSIIHLVMIWHHLLLPHLVRLYFIIVKIMFSSNYWFYIT